MPKQQTHNTKAVRFPTDFELFFRISADVMMVLDIDGKVIDFNNAYERISGYTREELFALNGGWDLILQDDLPKLYDLLSTFSKDRSEVLNFTLRKRMKNGTIKTISYDAILNKVTNHIYAIGRDITNIMQQEQRMEDTQSRLQFFFDHALDGMSIIVDGKYQMVNNAFMRIFGCSSPEDVVGRNFLDFVDSEFKEKVGRIVETNSDELYTSRIVRIDSGEARNVEVTGKTIQHHNQKVRISVVRDLDDRRNLQALVKAGEERFKTVFNNAALGIVLTDFAGNIVESNYTFMQRHGYTWDEIRNTQFCELFHEEDKPGVVRYMEALRNGQIENAFVEKRLITKNGVVAWSKMTCSTMVGAHGETLLLSLLENIDSQKRSEQALIESEVKFRAIYENSPMGIVITAAPGVIIDANPAFTKMMGYSDTELFNLPIIDLVHPADAISSGNWLQKIYKNEIPHYSIEKRFDRKDGTSFWAREVMSNMFSIGSISLSVAIIENIETQKRTEEALEQKNIELTNTNQELEHFAYVASHDLQEPLRTITSFIQILDKRYRNSLDEDAGQFIGFIVDGAKRMQTLIHDLLEYSRVNRFNTQFEKVDLNDVFHGVSSALKDKIENNDALVMAEQLPIVTGNRIQLTQVFQSLIDNAIKFKAKRRKPEVVVSVIEHANNWELIFADNGIGISQEYFQRIFIIFQRLHTLEEYTGTGIGLAICKKIIERQVS